MRKTLELLGRPLGRPLGRSLGRPLGLAAALTAVCAGTSPLTGAQPTAAPGERGDLALVPLLHGA